jgi:hypothetical protein
MTIEIESRVLCRGRGRTEWNPPATGTVVRIESGSVFVAWDDTCVEDQMDPTDLELLS